MPTPITTRTASERSAAKRRAMVAARRPPPLLRSPSDIHTASGPEDFPLTLARSLREREQRASDGCSANNCCADSGTVVIQKRRAILPRPKGENVFTVWPGTAIGARTLVRRKVGWREGIAISQRGCAGPAFLRDKSRAPCQFLARTVNTHKGEGRAEGEPGVANPTVQFANTYQPHGGTGRKGAL